MFFLRQIDHPYIVKLLAFHEDKPVGDDWASLKSETKAAMEVAKGEKIPEQLVAGKTRINYIVFDYCPHQTLFDYLCIKTLSLNSIVFYFRQLIEAMVFMHKHRVCHRDLKPENLLINQNFDLQLADYGFAAKLEGRALLFTCKGTLNYMAPEILNYEFAERYGYNGS